MKAKKGVMLVWITILVSIFVIMFLYLVFTDVYYNLVKPMSIDGINNITSNTSTGAIDTLNFIDVVWTYWPIIFIFGLLLYGFIAAQRREPNEAYY